jgi:hypothetical protein
LIEVAFFISMDADAAGAGEVSGKEKTPKGEASCSPLPWACSEELHDCHRSMGRYPDQKWQTIRLALCGQSFFKTGARQKTTS